MTDLMKRSFTRRERALLLVLLVMLLVGLYFLAVHFPIVNRLEAIDREQEVLLAQLETAQLKAAEYSAMKQELDEILSQPEEDITVMPAYNNIETLMRKLDVIFAGTSPDFTFNQVRTTDNVASRTIHFSCTAEDYQAARQLLREVTGTGWRCLLDSFTMNPEGETLYAGQIRLSGAITFYEYMPSAEEPAES